MESVSRNHSKGMVAKMAALHVLFCYASIVYLYATCTLAQNQFAAATTAQNYTTDSNRLKVTVTESTNRSYQEQQYLFDGSFRLLCSDSSTDSQLSNLRWALLDPLTNETLPVPSRSTLSNNGRDLTYNAINIESTDGGYYVCVGEDPVNGGRQVRSEPLLMDIISSRALAAAPSTVHRRNSLGASDAELVCNVIMKTPLPVRWSFTPLGENARQVDIDAPPTSVNGTKSDVVSKYNTEDAGQKLIIRNVTAADMGRYTCQLDTQAVRGISASKIPTVSTNFALAPYVKPFDTSRGDARSHIVGDPFEIFCNASVPTKDGIVRWYHGDNLINGTVPVQNETGTNAGDDDRITISTAPDAAHPESLISVLRIEELHNEDAGKYTCRVYSSSLRDSDSDNQQLTLKIKDKFAALYPFLAILAEVVVLIVIIFIYERRRNRKAALEYRAETGGEDDEETQPVNSSRHH